MLLEFTKMNGAGNDFVVIDNRAGKIKLTSEQVVYLCHRQRGHWRGRPHAAQAL